VTLGGAKAVGISQRRTRSGARLQCVLHRRWDPAATASLVHVGAQRDRLDRVLEQSVTSLELAGADPSAPVVDLLLAQLP
jgi:hypothetical protein